MAPEPQINLAGGEGLGEVDGQRNRYSTFIDVIRQWRLKRIKISLFEFLNFTKRTYYLEACD